MKFGLENKDLEWMCKIFSQFPDIDSVIVFGSRSMGNFKKGSDVDLVLIGNINPSIVNRVKFLLNEEIPLIKTENRLCRNLGKRELCLHLQRSLAHAQSPYIKKESLPIRLSLNRALCSFISSLFCIDLSIS